MERTKRGGKDEEENRLVDQIMGQGSKEVGGMEWKYVIAGLKGGEA